MQHRLDKMMQKDSYTTSRHDVPSDPCDKTVAGTPEFGFAGPSFIVCNKFNVELGRFEYRCTYTPVLRDSQLIELLLVLN
jgi:hypothetical protein